MNGFKSGAGSLDFGEEDEEQSEEESSAESEVQEAPPEVTEIDDPEGDPAGSPGSGSGTEASDSNPDEASTVSSTTPGSSESISSAGRGASESKYPYFVRRKKVGDERSERFEVFVREWVKNRESEYLNQLASELGVGDVSKTDGREFALIAAQENPEIVAELMREEGFDEV